MSKLCVSCNQQVNTSEEPPLEDWKNSKKFDGILCSSCDEPEHTFDCRNDEDSPKGVCNCV